MKRFLAVLVVIIGLTLDKTIAQVDLGLTFNHVALSVKDVNAAADFYKTVLQLQEITNRTKNPDIRWLSLGQGKELHLVSALQSEIKINKAVHFAVSTPNFEAFVARLKAQNITYSSWLGAKNTITTRPDGVLQVYIQDPDGYWIEINSVSN